MAIDNAEVPLLNGNYLLEKFPGKGGWTYAAIPEIIQDKTKPFGWVTVKGSIDDYELKQYKLMPMGNGRLFLPVKKAIRKKILKEAGDTVSLILYADWTSFEIKAELLTCFEYESATLLETFNHLTEGERKAYQDWIYGAKQEETRAKRIIEMMRLLEKGLRLHERNK